MIYYGSLGQTFSGATRTHVLECYPEKLRQPENRHGYFRYRAPKLALQSGDRLTVFNSVSSGQTIWAGELIFKKKDIQGGAPPNGITKGQWQALFRASMPVKLTHSNGEVINGKLHKWSDWGADCYNIFDYKNNSYNSLHNFGNGDHLEIFSTITSGEILWQGELKTSSVPIATGRQGLHFNAEGISRGEQADEYVANAFFTPSIKDVRKWPHDAPMMLERN